MRGDQVSKSRGSRVKGLGKSDPDIFYMSLDEAKRAITDKYEFLVDRYERRNAKKGQIKRAA